MLCTERLALVSLCRGLVLAALSVVIALPSTYAASDANSSVDLAALVASWPARYAVSGVKTEPTYLEAIDVVRNGDIFAVRGGAPAFAERSVESVRVDGAGAIVHLVCPRGMDCSGTEPPSGFLATAAVIAAARQGKLSGPVEPVPFGNRMVVCIPAERIGIDQPILDPCLDEATGAVLAQRHRLTGAFDGPTLEPTSMKIVSNTGSSLYASLPTFMEQPQ
jgi:hypothetical protein